VDHAPNGTHALPAISEPAKSKATKAASAVRRIDFFITLTLPTRLRLAGPFPLPSGEGGRREAPEG
jgi:hypothetical protein